jgi:hypothetical protein
MGGGGKNSAPAPTGFNGAARDALGGGIRDRLGQIGGQGALPTGQEARDQAITAAWDQSRSRLDPMWNQKESASRTQMINQGLDPGSQAFDTQAGNVGRDRNDAYSSAMANAIGQGTAAGNSIFQQGVTSQMLPYQQLGLLSGVADGQYQNDLQKYGADQAGKNGMLGGLGSLGGMIGGGLIGGPAGAAAGGSLGGRLFGGK